MPVKKILLVRPCAIGDLVQTLPAIGLLRRHFADAYIEILGNRPAVTLAEDRYYADATGDFGRRDLSHLFVDNPTGLPPAITDYIKAFDLVIAYLSGKAKVFEWNIRRIGVENVILFDPLSTIDRLTGQTVPLHSSLNRVNICDHLIKPVALAGVAVDEAVGNPRIYPSDEERSCATELLHGYGIGCSGSGSRVAAIHPGSGSKKKNWPIERFVSVARYLIDNCRMELLIVSGRADEEELSAVIDGLQGRSAVNLKDLPLRLLAAVLERVEYFIGNDSGISQIAAAVGSPSVLIFGPTEPRTWAPRGGNVRVARADYPCSPCMPDKWRSCGDQKCLDAVDINTVTGC